MALVFVVALCGVHELEVQGLFRELRGCVHAFVLPYGGIYEILVVALGFALLGLVLPSGSGRRTTPRG